SIVVAMLLFSFVVRHRPTLLYVTFLGVPENPMERYGWW
ncbi:MAG: hypothetical protein ACI9E1_002467, partial [Cryomorphaceae bacterium]